MVGDAESGRAPAILIGHNSDVRTVAFSPDGKGVVTTSSDEAARVWDAKAGASCPNAPARRAISGPQFFTRRPAADYR